MKIAAIIPIKNLQLAKSRLANVLTPSQRKYLVMNLLSATIRKLKRSHFLSEIILVSSDKEIERFSLQNNLKFIIDFDNGVNNAVLLADTYCTKNGINANIVIPPDLPFISAKEIDEICKISTKYSRCIIICPSKRFDGTNILFRKPPEVIRTFYDDNSYINHIREARRYNIPIKSLDLDKLMFDIDTEEDLLELFPHKTWNSVLGNFER